MSDSETVLPISGLTVVHAQGGMGGERKDGFEFRVGVARFSSTVYCLVDMQTTKGSWKVEAGLVAYLDKKVGRVVAELPDEELLDRISNGYLEHVLYDAASAAIRQIAAVMAADIQVPTQTTLPEYYMLNLSPMTPDDE